MNERRMSLGNRILSLVLALVMVIGMMPAGVLSVFADTTGNPDVTSNADTILQYAQGKLNDNHDKTASFSWDTEGKSDGWRYFNGVMLEAFLQNGLQASETETAYSFAQNYFDFYINESGSTFDAVLNELVQDKYESADSELDGVPPARNLAQLVGHVGFTDDKYANAVKVIYNNTIGQTEVDNTGGNFIHKENNSSWANWKVGLDGIYMAQPFLMEVAKAVKEERVDVGATYTAIADGVYNRLYWIANNMKYQTSDGVYLYHHGWGPGTDYKNGNGITWSRGTGWWVAGLADCIALMEDIGYDPSKITTLKGYLKEAIDGLLTYQHSSGLWYNVIYEQGEGTTTSNNFLEISGTGLFAYTIMKAYTRGWVTDAKYANAAIKAIDGIMGSSSYYSSGSFKNILKSSGVGTTVSYYNSTKSEDEAKGVGPIIMAASMYDDVKAMVSGGTKYTETFQIGAVNVTELPVVGTTVYANGLKATVVGSKGTIKDVTDLSATELSTELDGNKVKVLYNGNLIATVDAVIISTDATSGTGSFTVAEEATDPSTGTNDSASGSVVVEGSGSAGYSAPKAISTTSAYVIGGSSSSGKYTLALNSTKVTSLQISKWTSSNGIYTPTYEDTGDALTEWYFEPVSASDNTYYIYTNVTSGSTTTKYYLHQHDTSSTAFQLSTTDHTTWTVKLTGSGTGVKISSADAAYAVKEKKTAYLNIQSGTGGPKLGTSDTTINLFQKNVAEDATYTITLTAGSDGELMNKGDTKTLTATLTAVTGETAGTVTGTIVWASSNTDVATVDSNGKVTAVAAGDAIITATVTGATVSGSKESVDLSVEIPVKVTEAATYTVTLTLGPGSLVGKVNETGMFTPTVVIKNANNEDVTATFADSITYNGTIADTTIATVANDGTITYAKVGHTTFTQSATVNGTTVTATGNILVQADEAEHIHSYTASEEITQAPTCTATGSKKAFCSCGEYEVKTIPATGHSWNAGEITENATCNAAGTKTFTCTACGETKTEPIAATGNHTYVNGTCSVCGTTDPDYVEPGIVSVTAPNGASDKATVAAGRTLQLTANTVGGAIISWASGNPQIAEITSTSTGDNQSIAVITGKSVGTVTITATVTNAVTRATTSATFEVTVYEGSAVTGDWVVIGQTATSSNDTVYVYQHTDSIKDTPFTVTGDGKNATVSYTDSYNMGFTSALELSGSSRTVTFMATATGTLIVYYGHGSASRAVKVTGDKGTSETFTATADGTKKTVLKGTMDVTEGETYTITNNGNTVYLFRAEYIIPGSGSGDPTDTKWAQMSGQNITVTEDTVSTNDLLDMVNGVISIQESAQATGHTDAKPYEGAAYTLTWDKTLDATTPGTYKATVTVPFVITTNGAAANRETPATLGTITVVVEPAVECEHTYTGVVTAPTCTEQGYTTYTCSKCSHTYVDNYVAAAGHTEVVDEATAATCTETGLTEGKHCSVCGTVTDAQETIPALGHDWDEGEVTTAPTCGQPGVMTYICEREGCSTTKTEIIPATGEHNYGDDGKCTVCGATKPSANVSVTTGGVTGEAGTYNLVTSLETDTPYVFKSEGSSSRNPTVTEDSNGKLSFTSSATYPTWTANDDGTYTPSNTATPTFWYIDADGHLYTLNSQGVKYYVQDGLTSLDTEPGTYVWSLETNGSNTYLKITNEDGSRYARAKSEAMESKTSASNAGVVLAYTPSVTSGEQTTTDYLVEAIPQNLTVEAGSSVDPVVTLTGKDMEGNTVTVTGTLSYTPDNTGIAVVENGKIKGVSAGSTNVTAKLTNVSINGKTGVITGEITATFNVKVTPAPVSKDEWIHNVTTDGVTDADKFYDISKGSGNAETSSTSGSYGDLTFKTGIKMESSTEIEFTAPNGGTFTMVFRTSDKGKGININGTSHTIGDNGVLTVDVTGGETYTITKDDSVVVFYLEYASSQVDGLTLVEPGTIYMYVEGAASSAATHVMEYVVRHGEADVTNNSSAYSIAWSSDNESVATVSGGTISGIKPGTANITATVTMSDGTQYTATVPVKVEGATIGTTDEMNLMVDVEGKKTGTIGSNVHAAGVSTNEFTVGYLSSNESVATVAADGTVTAVGVGSATIYTYLKTVNGHTVYSGTPTVDTLPEQYAITAVTVTQREITDAHLNSYDYVTQKNNSGDKFALYELLEYKEDVVGSVHGEEGVKLTITYNTGDTIVAKFVDADNDGIDDNYETHDYGLRIDLGSIDITKTGIQIAVVTYTDAEGNELFRDSIWIHVEEYDPKDYDGTMTYEGNIRYELDTDGIEPNEEYVIVADRDTANGTGIAVMNPNVQSQASSAAGSNAVVIKTENSVESFTIANNSEASEWLFDTYILNVACPDGKNRTQLNISNGLSYVGPGAAETQLIHGNVAHVYLETVDASTGAYYIILGFNDDNQPYYLAYDNGVWHATTTANTLHLYMKYADVQDYGVKYDLYDKDNAAEIETAELIEGKSYDKLNPVITWGGDGTVAGTAAESYTIVWSSSDESVATVDQNGKVTALKEGTATITATLYDVDGFDVICNVHDTPYITKAVTVNVITDNATPTLTPSYLEIGQGSMPNLDKVNIEMSYGEGSENNYFVDHNLLNFRMADATNSAGQAVGFDSTTIDTYTVPVDYAGKTYYLTIKVVEDPYAGLDPADSIPGYPDAGSVRMDKVAEAVLDFTTTGVTKIELTAAGVSTKNSVDVILIVDVSNSMSWDINNSSNSTDANRIPTDGVDGVTKLDTAMDVADQFAKILLTAPGGDNTITFVTFAGQNGTTDSNVDSVRTPMVGVSDYSIASGVFEATEFTVLTKSGDSVKCTLNIGGYTDANGYGDASISGINRGNTNYDFAFGEAIDAIADLKAQYAANNNGASYDDSGRQIQVVFMTDGAPSHYNGKKANGSSDSLWSGSGTYSQLSGVTSKKASEASDSEKTSSMATWLTHMKNYNELATDLYTLADGFYVVGFDMDAGGFSFFQWGLADMTRVLEGLVKNTSLPVETADDNAALITYFNNLAQALAYPGTNAMVTDQIGSSFSLFTGAHMYSDDITQGGIMSEAILEQMQGKSFPITVASYRLVVVADIDSTLDVVNEDGTVSEGVKITEDHLGLRVAGEDNVDILETITFNADGTQAYSSVLGADNNIMVDDLDKMIRTIDASTFTYTATISPMKDAAGKVIGYHADQENIIWKLDTIADHELSMSYYAYLEGSLDNPRQAVAGTYATNNYAYLEYIDIYGKYVKRDYGVPQIAWGAGSVTVRFYLVNKDGQFVNRAGVVFTNPANRIFLNGRAYYETELNNSVSFTAADALLQAGLAGSNILYDVTAGATVTNSTTANQGSVSWIKNSSLNNINNLLTYTDSSNGFYTSVVIDIPVVMTDLGESDQKMSDSIVVIDYSNSVQWDALSEAERDYDGVEFNNVKYTIELVGFAKYNSSADMKDYVQEAGWPTTYATTYGTYEVVSGTDQIKFTPKAMLSGTDHVFAVFKFENLDKKNIGENGENMEYYYMYKLVSVVPATVVHYETTGNMAAAFQSIAGNKAWDVARLTDADGNIISAGAGATQSNANKQYGYDASYGDCTYFADGSALFVENTDSSAARPSVKFTFTGTGIDIISKTDPDQGRVKMTLTGKNTGTTKSVMVLNKGVDNLYQIPVLSVEGLPYDTYEVEIVVYSKTSAYGGQFYLDAINVYGSAQETEVVGSTAAGNTTVGSLYEAAGESKPQILEIRDILLGNNNFGDITASGVQGAVYIDGNTTLGDTSTNFNNYDKIGPNNEVYLSNNQAVAFKLRVEELAKLPTTLDIGLKSVNGSAAKAVIYVYKTGASDTRPAEYTVTTATAMFYDILGGEDIKTFLGENNEFYVVIANKGTGTLSVTDLKVGYGAAKGSVETVVDITVGSLTQETLKASAQVVSAAIANMNAETNTAIAYAMYTTTIVVVTGQDAESIVVEDLEGNEIAVNASYVDSDNGARRWRVLVRFNEVGTDTYNIYGIGTNGSRHDTYQQITVDVQLFAPANTN